MAVEEASSVIGVLQQDFSDDITNLLALGGIDPS
jgi:hypothetical protein